MSDQTAAAPRDRLLKMTAVVDMTGRSRRMIYRLVADHRFPQQYKPRGYAIRWIEAEVLTWVRGQREVSYALSRGLAAFTFASFSIIPIPWIDRHDTTSNTMAMSARLCTSGHHGYGMMVEKWLIFKGPGMSMPRWA
jgi:prophage regulatory protein